MESENFISLSSGSRVLVLRRVETNTLCYTGLVLPRMEHIYVQFRAKAKTM